ncbi:NADH-ubiquinone oxidoreductase 24 kDa subunit, mitochondrial [Cyberlindnera fabianii]|nr:NADH-ubiquinone oxidoreductase 24 kDa subunit, mitochondrial [Cyberlindnera fabianii]
MSVMLRRLYTLPRATPLRTTTASAAIFSTPIKRHHHIQGVHRDTATNNANAKFAFNAEYQTKVDETIAKYPSNYKKAAIMPLLDLGQRQLGYCSIGVMNEVARILEVPPMRVYEVASFYTMFQRQPVGKVHIGVCTNLPCMLRGGYDVYNAAKGFIKDNNDDGFYSIEEVECSGACANGPVAEINNLYYEDLEPQSMVNVLKEVRAGTAKPGPVDNKRVSCEPYGEKTSLFGKEAFDVKTVTRTDI